MISTRRARRIVVETVSPLAPTSVALREATGRVTAADLLAPFDLPRFPNSAMDGFALHSRATRGAVAGRPASLALQRGTIVAGSRRVPALAAGSAVRIMTGAPVPRGANAVLPQEEARLRDGALHVSRRIRAGAHIRRVGEDSRRGTRILPAGALLHPGTVAMLAAFGYGTIEVHRPPRIAVVVTGDEVHPPSRGRLTRSGVYDTHTAFLASALREFGLVPSMLTTARDRAPIVHARVREAFRRADLVLITGGVSVGERDVVRPVLKALGVETLFWGVAQKPGKPLYFGCRGGTFVFGLPGNPASTIACYLEYVRPAVRRMLGMARCGPEEVKARLSRPIARREDRTQFVRGRLARRPSGWTVTVVRREGSNRLAPFRHSDCLVVVPQGRSDRLERNVVVHPYPWSVE